MLIVVEGGLKRPAERMQSKVRAAANLCCTELRALPRVSDAKPRRLIPRQEQEQKKNAFRPRRWFAIINCKTYTERSGVVASAVASQQEGARLDSGSSHSPNTCSPGELGALRCM